MSWITGTGLTPFGKFPEHSTLDLMSHAAQAALSDAGLERQQVDGLLCGYSSTFPHLMLATVFAEHFGLSPQYAHAMQVGGASGLAMVMTAHLLIESGAARHILVVAGENRASGQSRDASVQTLAGVGHPRYEAPLGMTVPSYYALLASRYLHDQKLAETDLAELAVLMRQSAASNPNAHFTTPISVDDVMASRPISSPLKILDCCPLSDGGGAVVVSRTDSGRNRVRIRGVGQAHLHQHITAAASLNRFGAKESSQQALKQAKVNLGDVDYAAIYDSFTATLALLLEEIGFCLPGTAPLNAREGFFSPAGDLPLNTHGGLLSYGHPGVAGVLAHLIEACLQMSENAQARQLPKTPELALVHADGGVMSSHVSIVLETAS